MTRFLYCIALEGPAQEVTEWVLHSRESKHSECRGVYISSTPGEKIESKLNSLYKKVISRATIVTSLR